MSKESWPELVGMPWQEGEKKVKNEYPNIMVQVLEEGSMVTMDFREDRVRIFVNGEGKITDVPHIG